MKLKKDDNVKIIRGKDKGKSGKIEKVLPKLGKVLIANVNLYKRHLKARSQSQPSEIVTLTKPLSSENVILICPKCHKETRVGYKIEKGKKSRICKKCESEI
ncbi:MAG TPA: 50S ribosomal protein L24 [Candidatus Sulfotelmatobacter sp.]|nr:50S ribosomal protein L24 [Candidatus Sulfotelmatobacter sp.]